MSGEVEVSQLDLDMKVLEDCLVGNQVWKSDESGEGYSGSGSRFVWGEGDTGQAKQRGIIGGAGR
jgi:hypothetical protein